MAKISIIVPTYNERENLPILVEEIHNSLSNFDYELVIVDDNSPDGTGELAERLSREKPIKVIHRRGKLGLASAVVEGFKHSEGDILGVMDADLQHPPRDIPKLLKEAEKADIVIGSRYVEGGGVEKWSFNREFISRMAKLLPQILFAKVRPIKDPLSGFFLVKKRVIEGIDLNPVGYKILLEVLVKGRHNNVVEVPYVFKGRERGKSTFGAREQINYLRHLWRLAWSEGEILRFIKFCLVGLSGFAVNLGFYWLFTRNFGLHELASFFVSTELSIINNFTWNELWTFRDRRYSTSPASISGRGLKFHLVAWVGAGPSIASFWGLIRFAGVFDLIAAVLAIIIATVLKFIVNIVWTWR